MLFYTYNDVTDCMMSMEKLEELLSERFKAYSLNGNLQFDTEELDKNDRVTHLLMALVAIYLPQFKESFIGGEVIIFREKLKVVSLSQMKKEIGSSIEYVNCIYQNEVNKLSPKQMNKLQLVINTLQILYNKSSHAFRKSHPKRCRKLKVTLPFTFPIKLVAKREVEVTSGKVGISCCDWHKLLEIIFEILLEIEITLLQKSREINRIVYELEDDRFRQIITRFTGFLTGRCGGQAERLVKADELDEESRFFPPCMANLHQILRKTHRLSYDSRYQYTLFLKDIGLSVDENIAFWESEYSKPAIGSSCTHEWEEKHKRYIYQIQHLYGLIGTHGLKTSHSCDKFINDVRNKMDAGCPFQHFSVDHLEKSIPHDIMELPDVEDIFKYKKSNLPQKACAAYLQCQKKLLLLDENYIHESVNTNKIALVISPLYYYNMAKNSCS